MTKRESRIYVVSTGSMREAEVRAHTPLEAFYIAVIFNRPKSIGRVALVQDKQKPDDDHTWVVPTYMIEKNWQKTGDLPSTSKTEDAILER